MVAYRGATSAHSGTVNVGSLAVSLAAAGAQAGDQAMLVAEWNVATAVLSAPAGWTALDAVNVSTTTSIRAFHKVLDAADISTDTLTVNSTSAGNASISVVAASDPGALQITSASDPANDLDQPIAGIDPTTTALVVVMAGINYNAQGIDATAGAGWTERTDSVSTNSPGRRGGTFSATYDTISDAPVPAATITTNSNSHGASWTFAVNEAGSEPAPAATHYRFDGTDWVAQEVTLL